MQPIHQWANGRVFIILQQGSVVKGAQQFSTAHELLPQQLVVDIEPKRLCGGIEVRPIDEQRQPIILIEHIRSFQIRLTNRTLRIKQRLLDHCKIESRRQPDAGIRYQASLDKYHYTKDCH
jgi:hypothetical protein